MTDIIEEIMHKPSPEDLIVEDPDSKVCYFDKVDECSALRVKNCPGCAFFVNAFDFKKNRELAMKRIRDLEPHISEVIIDKYSIRDKVFPPGQGKKPANPW